MARQPRRGRYYVSRVHKSGRVTDESIISALKQPSETFSRLHGWTFIDVQEGQFEDGIPYIFGLLAKYDPAGVVPVLNRKEHSQEEHVTADLIIAASPFVFIPAYAGVAHLHVWNDIEAEMFRQQFGKIIEAAYESFFASCTLEVIVDLRTFATRLRDLDVVQEISAKVHPPNPAFGRAWGSLKVYMANRNSSEVAITETANAESGINSQLLPIVEGLAGVPAISDEVLDHTPIADAAVLMAADGYGSATVKGLHNETEVSVTTGKSQIGFLFAKKPLPDALAKRARQTLEKVFNERRMEH